MDDIRASRTVVFKLFSLRGFDIVTVATTPCWRWENEIVTGFTASSDFDMAGILAFNAVDRGRKRYVSTVFKQIKCIKCSCKETLSMDPNDASPSVG